MEWPENSVQIRSWLIPIPILGEPANTTACLRESVFPLQFVWVLVQKRTLPCIWSGTVFDGSKSYLLVVRKSFFRRALFFRRVATPLTVWIADDLSIIENVRDSGRDFYVRPSGWIGHGLNYFQKSEKHLIRGNTALLLLLALFHAQAQVPGRGIALKRGILRTHSPIGVYMSCFWDG